MRLQNKNNTDDPNCKKIRVKKFCNAFNGCFHKKRVQYKYKKIFQSVAKIVSRESPAKPQRVDKCLDSRQSRALERNVRPVHEHRRTDFNDEDKCLSTRWAGGI